VATSLFTTTKWISLAIKHSKWTIASGQNWLVSALATCPPKRLSEGGCNRVSNSGVRGADFE